MALLAYEQTCQLDFFSGKLHGIYLRSLGIFTWFQAWTLRLELLVKATRYLLTLQVSRSSFDNKNRPNVGLTFW